MLQTDFCDKGNISMYHSPDIPSTILIIDEERHSRALLRATLETLGHNVVEAVSCQAAPAKVNRMIDMVMFTRDKNQVECSRLIRHIRNSADIKNIPILVIVDHVDRDTLTRLLQEGVNDYLVVPFDKYEVMMRITSLLKLKHAEDALRNHGIALETQLIEADLQNNSACLNNTDQLFFTNYCEALKRLCAAAEYKEQNTGMHIRRVSCYCELLAQKLKLPDEEVHKIKVASAMHDIGKICIPKKILCKPGKLDKKEWQVMKLHTIFGGYILQGSDSTLLQAGRTIALSHHEKWDGSGYPKGLKGEAIPLYGRICILADTFDVLTSLRPYKAAYSMEEALRIMIGGRGTMYDPYLYDLFVAGREEISAIMSKYKD